MPRRPVTTDRIAPPVGPFPAATLGTPTACLSGQIDQDRATGELVGPDAATQARQVLHNVFTVLEAAGKSEREVLRVASYLTDMADLAAVNTVYEEFVTAPCPARTAVAVAGLPHGALVEADLVLSRPPRTSRRTHR